MSKALATCILSVFALVAGAAFLNSVAPEASASGLIAETTVASVAEEDGVKEETSARRELRKNLSKAVRSARKKGEISGRDVVRIRVASLSPAFLENVEDLAVVQIASSGIESDDVPIDDEGRIIRTSIDWEGLIAFLEKLLPLILTLIDALG